MSRLRRVTLEFEDGGREVLDGPRAEAWRQAVDRALTVTTLQKLEDGSRRAESGPGIALWEFLEDLGERGVSILLYLYRGGGLRGITTEDVAEDMGLPVDDVEEVLEKLRSWGFLEEVSEDGQDWEE